MSALRGVVRREGRTFDWNPNHDPKSRAYGVRKLVTAAPTKPVWWTGGLALDQGEEGTCAGHAVVAEYLASPVRGRVRNADAGHQLAVEVFDRAAAIDEFPGAERGNGTSINAVMKVGRERGWWQSYHWAFGIEDVKLALLLGPVVIGIPWYESMYETLPDGTVAIGGELVGGHALLITGWSPKFGRLGETFRWRNSWGPGYGRNGNGYIHARDLARLLDEDGEAAVPTQRQLGLAA